MKETEYAYAVAYMKTFENKMLTKADMEALINARGYDEALKILSGKGYGGDAQSGDIDEILNAEMRKIWKEAIYATPSEAPLDILKYKNDFHNLKTVLKAFLTNAEWENLMLLPSAVKPEEIYEAVKKADFSDLPEFLRGAAEGGYKMITAGHDGQAAEIYIDKAAFAAMEKAAKGNAFLEGWVRQNALFADFSIALRAGSRSREFIENAMIPVSGVNLSRLVDAAECFDSAADVIGGMGYAEGAEKAKQSVGEFEKWCDNKKMEYLKSAKNKFFGFEPIMAFILGKEAEIQAVRIILSGHKNEIPAEIIRERLRDLYV